MKKVLKVVLIVILAVVVLAAGYLAYVLIDFHRIPDKTALNVEANAAGGAARVDTPYELVSWNVGFGAYESDYGFFMDGGTESRAWSRERLEKNMERICRVLQEQDADFYLIQEVDLNSTRSYHMDQVSVVRAALPDRPNVWAQNYDSPFLMYPPTRPFGKAVSGIMTFTPGLRITEAIRRQLPIETGFTKFLDLDRCYSVCRVNVEGADGKELVLYNMHLSAYTSDGTIADEQLRLLIEDMKAEYARGNYVVCGGDFNKDVLGDSSVYFGKSDVEYTWAQPLPDGIFDGTGLRLVAPVDEDDPVPSCRNADGPYHEGQYVLTIDGFIVSNNVKVENAAVEDLQFACSDHNPVEMTFTLLP
ncbi:MAG: endonuclease/exonuclease/phosphatase family protein [Oscillospiraceae bacterium]|nr:endonuclease/exonuclease/phosphatase family protein [Oscillospiraceae bacterium]